MTFPAFPDIPDPWPDRAQGQTAFDAAVSATFTFLSELGSWADGYATGSQGLAAALVAGNLPDLAGNAGRAVIVNDAADGVTFSGPVHLLAGHRNKVINGQFVLWERGTSFTADGYTADRWELIEGAGAACTISRVPFTPAENVPGDRTHYLRFARATAGSSTSSINQKIEGVGTLQGRTATVTFWAKASAATEIRCVLVQSFGSGGSPSADVFAGAPINNVALGTGWTKCTGTIALPGIAGKTLGTDANSDHLWLRIQRDHNDTNPTASVDIANVSLVEGDATNEDDPGAWRPLCVEQLLASRYYQRVSGGNIGAGRHYTGTSGVLKHAFLYTLPVSMRAVPTASVVSPPTYQDCSAIELFASGRALLGRVTTAAGGDYRAYGGTYDLDAEL